VDLYFSLGPDPAAAVESGPWLVTPAFAQMVLAAGGVTLTAEQSTYLDTALAAVSTAIRRWCDRDFTVTEYTETHAPHPDGSVFLRQFPVLSVAEVLDWRGVPIDPEDYDLDDRTGTLTLRTPVQGKLTVTYTAGFDPIPADVQQATVEALQGLLGRSTAPADGIVEEKLGDYSYKIDSAAAAAVDALPRPVRQTLASYRIPRL
jgi:hypothetical protein